MQIKTKIKKQNGFTLIELILYLGITILLTIGIYTYYQNRKVDAILYTMNNNLSQIDKSINAMYSTVASLTSLNNQFAIETNIIPKEMVIGIDKISNKLGGFMTIASSTIAGNPAYSMTFDGLSGNACSKIATNNFSTKMQEISVNGVIVKSNAGSITPAQINASTKECKIVSNTVVYKNILPITMLDPVGSTAPIRVKEAPQYIASVGFLSTGASGSCGGGTTWNGSFCSCPIATEWNGSACIAFNTTTPQAGWCQRGQGWTPINKICSALPNGSSGNSYVAGRNIPQIIVAPPTQTVPGGQIVSAITTEVIAGRTITSPVGQLDNNTVQVCVNGAWDVTSRRCITP